MHVHTFEGRHLTSRKSTKCSFRHVESSFVIQIVQILKHVSQSNLSSTDLLMDQLTKFMTIFVPLGKRPIDFQN